MRSEDSLPLVNPSPRFVLDSFALLAYFQDERGASRVDQLLRQGAEKQALLYLSSVNYAEVLYRVERTRGIQDAETAAALMGQHLPIQIMAVDVQLAASAAHLKAIHPISLADCCAAALAQQQRATVVTGDSDFARLTAIITVEWL